MADLKRVIGRLRESLGETQSQFGARFAVDQSSVSRWERGAAPDLPTLREMARLSGSSLEVFLSDAFEDAEEQEVGYFAEAPQAASPMVGGLSAPLVGVVQAGAFCDALSFEDQGMQLDLLHFALPPNLTSQLAVYDAVSKVAFEVRGDSMDRIYPDGSLLLCLPFAELGRAPRAGERVIIQAVMPDGHYEATVKTIRIVENAIWACPESSNPAHNAINLSALVADEVQALALVIASLRPEVAVL